jgi:hypothetical protein
MGTLPRIFDGERDKADAFMNELLGYLLLNHNVPGFESPIRQVAMALTLIKGPRVDQWVRDMTTWLRGLDPLNDNVPRVWDYFTDEFERKFVDSTKTQRSRQQLEKLRFRFPEVDQYIADFEDLANLSGYTVGNDETINLFLKGFENARDILAGILAPPVPVTYYAIKERAVSVTKSRQLINAIQRNAPGGFNTFRPPNRPFFQRQDRPRGQGQYTQRQYNSTNAPPWLNNTPVPMDTSARTRAPPNRWNNQGRDGQRGRGNQRTYGNVAQTNDPPRRKGPCFKCGKEGHFARDCRSTRINTANYMDFDDDLSQMQEPLTPENILDNAIRMFDTLPTDQKDAFIQKYEGGQEDFAGA